MKPPFPRSHKRTSPLALLFGLLLLIDCQSVHGQDAPSAVPTVAPSVIPTAMPSLVTFSPVPPVATEDLALASMIEAFPYTADLTLFGSNFAVPGGSFPMYRFCFTCTSQGAYTPRPSEVGALYIGNRIGDDLRFTIILDEILSSDIQNDPTIFTEEVMDLITGNNVTADFIRGTIFANTRGPVEANCISYAFTTETGDMVREMLIISDPNFDLLPTSTSGRRQLQETNPNDCPNFVAEVQAEETTYTDCPGNDVVDRDETCVANAQTRYEDVSSGIVDRNTRLQTTMTTAIRTITVTGLAFAFADFIQCLFARFGGVTLAICLAVSWRGTTARVSLIVVETRTSVIQDSDQINADFIAICNSVREQVRSCFSCVACNLNNLISGARCCDDSGCNSGNTCANNVCVSEGSPRFTLTWFGDDALEITIGTPSGSSVSTSSNGADFCIPQGDPNLNAANPAEHTVSTECTTGLAAFGTYTVNVVVRDTNNAVNDPWSLAIVVGGTEEQRFFGSGAGTFSFAFQGSVPSAVPSYSPSLSIMPSFTNMPSVTSGRRDLEEGEVNDEGEKNAGSQGRLAKMWLHLRGFDEN